MSERTKTCLKCGTITLEESRFCAVCGSPFPEMTPAARRAFADDPHSAVHATQPKKRRNLSVFVGAVVGVLIGLAIVGGVLYFMGALPFGGTKPSQGYDALMAEVEGLPSVDAELVSLDATDFPVMRAYLRVGDGSPTSLSSPRVAILEGVTDGEQLEREVRSMTQVAGTQGQSYAIAVDRSGSMDQSMPRVREILSEFVDSLDYATGDRAELLSFDTYVMWMCSMTGDASRLKNGVGSMEPWGETALWDALCEAVSSVGTQAGSRCVVAFTDGGDNSSARGPDDVASLAEALDVPIFVVGTDGADEAALRDLVSRCGGAYLPIDDVEGLSQALGEVRERERGLWCVEYVCDGSSAADASRQLSVVLSDGTRGCKVAGDAVPAQHAAQQQPHASRYELVKADISWTDANAECMRRGGHLVTINSQEEMDAIAGMCEAEGMRFCWMGGYTSLRNGGAFAHWVTGEPFDFQVWWPNEPSRTDRDGMPEMYLILWKPKEDGGWSFNDERDRPFEDEEMQHMRGKMCYVCEWEDVDAATAPVASAADEAAPPQPEPAPEPVTLAGNGITFRVPDALAAYEGVELINDDKGLPCVKCKGTSMLWLTTDLAYWDSTDSHDVIETRDVTVGKLQMSTGENYTISACLSLEDGQRLELRTRLFMTPAGPYGDDAVFESCRACQAAVCGMAANDDLQRLAMEFLVACANGITFDPLPEPAPEPEPEVPTDGTNVADDATFVVGGMRFTIPEYWRGKVDLASDGSEVTVRLAGTGTTMFQFNYAPVGGSYPSENAMNGQVTWERLNGYSPSSYMDEYPLPDGSMAFEYGGGDGFTESLYKTADGGIIDCKSWYLMEYAQMQDLMSMGGEADASDYSSYPSNLWARATRV